MDPNNLAENSAAADLTIPPPVLEHLGEQLAEEAKRRRDETLATIAELVAGDMDNPSLSWARSSGTSFDEPSSASYNESGNC